MELCELCTSFTSHSSCGVVWYRTLRVKVVMVMVVVTVVVMMFVIEVLSTKHLGEDHVVVYMCCLSGVFVCCCCWLVA